MRLFLNTDIERSLRDLFGAHLLIAPDIESLDFWSKFFQRGRNGKLRDPDPELDPEWVKAPRDKGILKVNKSDIIKGLGGDG